MILQDWRISQFRHQYFCGIVSKIPKCLATSRASPSLTINKSILDNRLLVINSDLKGDGLYAILTFGRFVLTN